MADSGDVRPGDKYANSEEIITIESVTISGDGQITVNVRSDAPQSHTFSLFAWKRYIRQNDLSLIERGKDVWSELLMNWPLHSRQA